MRVAFWGTPEFATPSLRALIGEGHEVVVVVTQPDRAVGRHRSTVVPSPVKQVALDESIPVLQPASTRDPDLPERLRAFAPDISVVVAYGQLLTDALISLPTQSTINVHASLLPALRGAAPIQGAIRQGLTVTGVSIMRMVRQLDAGPVIVQNETPVHEDETAGELQMRLSELGALSLVQAMVLIELGKAEFREQDHAMATYAGRVTRDHARINWQSDAIEVARGIRAYDPKPGAFTALNGLEVRLFGVRPIDSRSGDPGVVIEVDESGMLVGCGRGCVRVTYAHPAGRRRMAALDWSQGRGVSPGDIFNSEPGAQ